MIHKITILLLICSTFAFSKPDQKSLDAADELAQILGLKDQMVAGFNAMSPIIDQQAKQMKLNEDQTKQFRAIYKAWFEEDFDHKTLSEDIINLYAETFTINELKELTAFYKTPIGIKALKVFPKLMGEGAKLGAVEGQKKQAKLLERMQPLVDQKKAENKSQ